MSKSRSGALFTKNLQKLMKANGATDAEVGVALGVSRTTVWRWRNGRQEPREDRDALAKYFGVPVSKFYGD